MKLNNKTSANIFFLQCYKRVLNDTTNVDATPENNH